MDQSNQIETLKGLLKRVRSATGEDGAPALWYDILLALLDPDGIDEQAIRIGRVLLGEDNGALWTDGTESVDAALALVSRVLPTFGYRLQTEPGGRLPVCTLHAPPECPEASITDGRSWSRHYEGGGATPGLAICSAILSAKLALLNQEESDGR